MKLEAIIDHIDAGMIPEYRRIKNNTYAVKSTTLGGETVFGIQLHRTVVFAYVGYDIFINDGGWPSPTTRDRVNDALSAAGLPAYLYQKNRQQYLSVNYPRNTVCEFSDRKALLDIDGNLLKLDPQIHIFPVDVPVSRSSYYKVDNR